VVANKADRPIGGSAGTITSDKQGFFVQWGDVACDTFGGEREKELEGV
jgi:ABC-type Fe2+-enterobactin transport system substrate-binding protein